MGLPLLCEMDCKSACDNLDSLATVSFPLLVYDHGEQPNNSQVVFSIADGTSRTCRIPELSNCRCLETSSGLVLTVNNATLQSSMWNPRTGEKIPLPTMDKSLPEDCHCVLSDTISSPDCIVLIYDFHQPELLLCKVRNGSVWVSHTYDLGFYNLPESYCAPKKKLIVGGMAGVQGKFYFIDGSKVGVLTFDHNPEPQLKEIDTFRATLPTTIESAEELICISTFVMESCHELFLVCFSMLGPSFERVEEFGAYKMDFSKKEWCKLSEADIGDKVFLLGPGDFATSRSTTETGLKRGCVYHSNDMFDMFAVFDLLKNTCDIIEPIEDIPDDLSRGPFWMVPVLP